MTDPQFLPGKAYAKADVHDTLGGQAENIESYAKIIHCSHSFLTPFYNISYTAKEQPHCHRMSEVAF